MTSKEAAKKEITKLVAQFKEHEKQYKNSDYNETQTRQEFIDPFFKALGWDIDNNTGLAPSYKEVQHEDRVKVEGKLKSPDYSFRYNGKRFFFVEAKKPIVNIKDDSEPAYQIRRYAWSANLNLSILTDFEEFAYYDCSSKPNQSDKASKSRLNYIKYTEYIERFDEIWNLFSKEAIVNGNYDSYLKTEKKKGKDSVDDDFLKSLLKWREILAKDIHKQNKNITEDHLNYVVQNTIDRIIFLRIAEDRNIETYGEIKKTLGSKNVYEALLDLFKNADDKYNSGLFNFDKDKISKTIIISNKCLNEIIDNLYFPNSPYEFSVIPVEILGSAYEQFLGKTIQIKGSKIAIEDKPEVRKAGGVYYTPQYIVDYIVQNTVGKLVEGKTPKEIEKIKILDPASGSGSFLLGAYDYLLKYHLDWYTKNSSKSKGKKNDPLNPDGSLTTEIKKNILLNNIYGVDIDVNAVEVTKLSLLLKCLEGETEASLQQQMSLFHERVLPTLDSNIKCGNSLVDTDFYEIESDRTVLKKVKPFNWEAGFPEVFRQGGFNAVIGNPPYKLVGSDESKIKEYYKKYFKLIRYKINLYILFLEKGLNLLKKGEGKTGFIIPKSLLFNTFFRETRLSLVKNFAISTIIDIKGKVFKDAEVGDSIIFIGKNAMLDQYTFDLDKADVQFDKLNIIERNEVKSEKVIESLGEFYHETSNFDHVVLSALCDIYNGLNPGNVRHILLSKSKKTNKHKKMLLARDVLPYATKWSGTWVNFDPSLKSKIKVTDIKSKKGMTAQKKVDFALRKSSIYNVDKILVRKTGDKIIATLDLKRYYYDSLSYGIIPKPGIKISIHFVLGVLMSKYMQHLHGKISNNKGKVFAKVLLHNLKQLPFPKIDLSKKKEKHIHDNIVTYVIKILELKMMPNPDQNQIDHYEKRIDAMVYELYGLTEDEIKLVEGATDDSGK